MSIYIEFWNLVPAQYEVMEEKQDKVTDSARTLPLENEKDELQQQIRDLQAENRKMQNEFNAQRAKLKELFIQKESELAKREGERQALQRELDELKSQFLVADLKSENELRFKEMKAHEEISSLQQLVQDTIEESAIYKAELERLKAENNNLLAKNNELRENQQQQQHSESQEYAQEDAEVLRSIVVQLQEEMKALKEKLREADDKLQTKNVKINVASNFAKEEITDDNISISKSTSMDMAAIPCEACLSNEQRIQDLLAKSAEYEISICALQKSLTESREDLQKEAALRKDLEGQWQEKREAHKTEVQLLREQVKLNEQQLLDLQQTFLDTKEEVTRQLQRVTDERERVNKHLETLQADNDYLSGRYLASAEEIENQYINLPNTVEELHELILRQQSELIQARVSSEFQAKKCVTSLDEIQILRDQLDTGNNDLRAYKKKCRTEIKSLQDRLTEHLLTLQNYETTKTALERKEAELNRRISELRVEVIELQEANEKLSKMNADYKAKIKNLQEDLATSEQVQKDFVKLSQNLQMSLEKLRKSDTEVRWQEDEDVDNCPTCNTYFTVTVRKIHCRHCGQIYCDKCLTKTVPSGPRKKVVRVCDICHTLLTPNTAPYFSHETSQSS